MEPLLVKVISQVPVLYDDLYQQPGFPLFDAVDELCPILVFPWTKEFLRMVALSLVTAHRSEWLFDTHFLMMDLAQDLAISINGSGADISERTPRDASLSAISLPLIPVCSGIQRKCSATIPSASLHSPTKRERVFDAASALRVA